MEELIALPKAAKKFPGRTPHVSTLHRWADHGVGGVRLKTTRVGRRRYTTEEAIATFLRELNTSDAEQLESEGC